MDKSAPIVYDFTNIWITRVPVVVKCDDSTVPCEVRETSVGKKSWHVMAAIDEHQLGFA
jgi:hypothetical protein